MNKFLLLFFSLVSFSFSQSLFPVSDENGEARDRTYHVLHYKIEVSFDESKKMVFGKVTTTLVPFMAEFTSLEFDAENMNFKNVSLGKKGASVRFIGKNDPYSSRQNVFIPRYIDRVDRIFLYSSKKDCISSSLIRPIPISRGRSGRRVKTWTIISGFPAGTFRMIKRRPKLSER